MRETVKNNCQLLEEGEFSLPKGWEVKKLGEVGNIFNGNSINAKVKKEKYSNLSEGLNYIATKDISYESVINYDNGIKIPDEDKSSFKIASQNTILICAEGGSAGRKIAFTDQEVCFGNKLFALITTEQVNSRFVYYYYFNSQFQEDFLSQLTGIIGGVSMAKFKKLKVPLPSLSEQQRIVKILDKAFVAIDKAKQNAEQNLKNAKELFESYLNRIFEEKGDDWEEKTWGELIEIRSGRNQKEVLNPNGKYPVLGSAGKIMGYADKYICEKGTTVIGRKGTIDKPLFIETNFWNVDTAFGLIAGKSLTKEFLLYFCKSFNFKELDKGTTLPSLVKKDLITITMSYPKSKEEQKCIVTQLNDLQTQTKKLETIYQHKINNLVELKKTILQKAFKGEL
ncbi:restriction endonuclease subunit S [bacterium endosymbiont of Bathymodiolus sp. 5 South]|jgi:type I restriction enzyme S subunit|uniref:restriction endonuclease subunit S n=1 Tax=bacterium endosymbiont of Bathymodiolus sp. 5 South TaxID=1181670 RepID=UPI0010B6F241|nr:restriction endonuclease subunit S [bacterium endosymbiont of Bathymodiolus sp. 5 South]CAC9651271.1 Type I restriction-modification system, specificity subunit S [uncultured Gammaproteobacteria bacterium]SHN91994.1 Type I restriction-modification system, specificity subunit S [bacterium endosymbiont of Bathymodiolus sp. 5 South]VVH57679.1 Type I restriction-modification system, specificity subunit S (EC [uncultured Gammaproteobacteria bacterium]